ncbi:MAG: cytochrome c oxidase assembly factor Coa1 family protein [Stenotrophomonas sp.]|uniref:cytochrome c oxidase assembly factor Coa1 family protein n=1 Tax=Stenotrophomonas sp. TaxID=69392 RepID=UPI0028A8100B|nr:cytochrome c oxidase assembly factor Coa1 family protein [Stenotrophomonas sp.]
MSAAPPPLPGSASGKPPRNWFQRNLKWVLPLAVVVMLGGWGLASWSGFRQMSAPLKSSEPYQQALARARAAPEVQAALGQPIEEASFVFGNIGRFADVSQASMLIRISGPHGKAGINLEASRSGNAAWQFDKLSITLPGRHEKLDLRTADEKLCAVTAHCP